MHLIIDMLKILFAAVIAPLASRLIQELAALVVKQLTSEGKLQVKAVTT